MSLIIFLFWIWVPIAIIATGVWLWRSNATTAAKGAVVTSCTAALGWFLWLAVGEVWWADQQVREFCAKDGGIKVYETVKLSTEKYEEMKLVNFNLPDKSQLKPTDEYYYELDGQVYEKNGNPKWVEHHKDQSIELTRSHFKIYRRLDNKLLGESIRYGRGGNGGGLPGPWHGSSFNCPEIRKEIPSIETSVFIKADK